MNNIQLTYEKFLSTSNVQISIFEFAINMVLTVLLSYILSIVYIKYGNSLSNRKEFAKNFLLLTMTTMLVISIVKSSLALSLGLVGALSIVRFRSAIKEPEELTYLFFSIALGLGFGANQSKITIVAFIIIVLVIAIKGYYQKESNDNIYNLIVLNEDNTEPYIEELIKVLNQYCLQVQLRRYEINGSQVETYFGVYIDKFENFNELRKALLNINNSLKITFMDNKGII